jgi:hypothetical protein
MVDAMDTDIKSVIIQPHIRFHGHRSYGQRYVPSISDMIIA